MQFFSVTMFRMCSIGGTVEPQITLGPEGVWYSEKFGILKLVLFLWATCTIFMFYKDIHSHFTWFAGFVVLSVRYSEVLHAACANWLLLGHVKLITCFT